MKAFLKELFEYNLDSNFRLIERSLEHEARIPEKSQKWFSHILTTHEIWSSRILKRPSQFAVWQLLPVREWNAVNQANFEVSCSILDEFQLDRKINYVNSLGDAYVNSVQDILFHIINHSTHHRGQIAANFRDNGLEPLATDYIFYKR